MLLFIYPVFVVPLRQKAHHYVSAKKPACHGPANYVGLCSKEVVPPRKHNRSHEKFHKALNRSIAGASKALLFLDHQNHPFTLDLILFSSSTLALPHSFIRISIDHI